jgi:hypothetical protein
VEKYKKSDARNNCANWNAGKCLGALMFRKDDVLHYTIDKDMHGKDCFIDKGCDYFDNIVVPGITK